MPYKFLALLVAFVGTGTLSHACTVCRPKVEAAIHSADYTANALLMLLPIALLVGGALLVYFSPNLSPWKPTTPRPSTARP